MSLTGDCRPENCRGSGWGRYAIVNYFSRLQLDQAICYIKVMIVVADDQNDFALCFQVRQEFAIKIFPEPPVLIRGPLIENINWTVFENRGKQGQTLSLPLGQLSSGENSIPDGYF